MKKLFIALFSLCISSMSFAQVTSNVLPKPPKPFKGTIEKTFETSKDDYPQPRTNPDSKY